MEEEQKLELITRAIRRLLEQRKNLDSSDPISDENDDRTLLSNLLSQIESLKLGAESEEVASAVVDSLKTRSENATIDDDNLDVEHRKDIVKELKKVERQNFLTHCLLSVMIVLTVVWQVSEVSIILSLKDKVSHPFKSFGSMLLGALKPPKTAVENTEKDSSKQNHDEAPVLPSIKVPELDLHLPELGFNGVKH